MMQSILLAAVLSTFALSTLASPPVVRQNGTDSHPPCPVAACDPDPTNNKCDITTACLQTSPTSEFHCACRAGYRAAGDPTDTKVQYRSSMFQGQEYRVFVANGVKCDTLCDQWWLGPQACQEVASVSDC